MQKTPTDIHVVMWIVRGSYMAYKSMGVDSDTRFL